MQDYPDNDMMPELQQALSRARARGASAARVFCAQDERVRCEFDNARLKATTTCRSRSIQIEVLLAGRRGRTTLNDPSDLDEMVDRAIELARAGSTVHFTDYPAPTPLAGVQLHSPRTAALSLETLVRAGQRVCDTLKAEDRDLFIQADGQRDVRRITLLTSGGVLHCHTETRWELAGGLQRTDGTDMLFSSFSRSWRDLNELFDPARISDPIIEDLRHGRTIVPAPTGSMTILVSPEILRLLLRGVELGISGRTVAKGESPLRDKLGAQVFDPCLTIVDDPHLDFCDGAAAISDEGVATSRTTIVERGLLRHFLYDLDSAAMAGVAPTGHDRCQPYSLDVAPGQRTSGELIGSIQDGLYIKDLLGFGQSNLLNGDFACNVALGFRIRGGAIVGRVKNTMVAGNIYDLLQRDVQLSSDRDPVLRMPYALLQGAQVSAAKTSPWRGGPASSR